MRKKDEQGYVDLLSLREFLKDNGCTESDLIYMLKTKTARKGLLKIKENRLPHPVIQQPKIITQTEVVEKIVYKTDNSATKDLIVRNKNLIKELELEKVHNNLNKQELDKANSTISNLNNKIKKLNEKLKTKIAYEKKISKCKPGIPQYIDELDVNGNIIATYNSIRQASRETGCHVGGIRNCLIGVQHQCGGRYFVPAKTIPPKKCPRCGETKEIQGNFQILKTGRVTSYCIPCNVEYNNEHKAMMKERYEDPLEYFKEQYGDHVSEEEIIDIYNNQLSIGENRKYKSKLVAHKYAYNTTNKLLSDIYKGNKLKKAMEVLNDIT